MSDKLTPIRPTDAEAIALGRLLIADAAFGALGVIDPKTAAPLVTRIAVATLETGIPFSLISDLSNHTKALRENPACSLLVGEPKATGDPLTYPRLSLSCHAEFVARRTDDHAALRDRYLALRPKAKLYIDFADFNFAKFRVLSGNLNGGFGKAYELTAADLG